MHRFYYWIFGLSLIGIYAKLFSVVNAAYGPLTGMEGSSVGLQLFWGALIGFVVCLLHLLGIYGTLHEFECPKDASTGVISWFKSDWKTSSTHRWLMGLAGGALVLASLKASGLVNELVGLVPRSWLWENCPRICEALLWSKPFLKWLLGLFSPGTIHLLFGGSFVATACLLVWDVIAKRNLAPAKDEETARRRLELTLWIWMDGFATAFWLTGVLVVYASRDWSLVFFLVSLGYTGFFLFRRIRDWRTGRRSRTQAVAATN